MRKISAFLAVFLACAAPARSEPPKKLAIVFGGNCESSAGVADKANQFLAPMHNVTNSLKQKGWEVNSLYDGDLARCTIPASDPHCIDKMRLDPADRGNCCAREMDTEAWRSSWLEAIVGKEAVRRGSKVELLKALEAAEKLPTGSQLFLSINTHGSAPRKKSAHSLCLSDGTSMPVNDPDFLAGLDRLKNQKGLKIAFADESCFSGGSVPVLRRYGCVVASQTENRVSYGAPFSKVLQKILNRRPGKVSLADLFQEVIDDPKNNLVTHFSNAPDGGGASVREFNTISPQISGLSEKSVTLAELFSRFFVQHRLPSSAVWWHNTYDRENACKESVYGTEANFSAALERLATTVVAGILPMMERARFEAAFEELRGLSQKDSLLRAGALSAKYFADQEKLAVSNRRYEEMLKRQMAAGVAPILDLRDLSAKEREAFMQSLAERSGDGIFTPAGGENGLVLPLQPLRDYNWKMSGSSFNDFLWRETRAYAEKMLPTKPKAPAQRVTALQSKLMPVLRRAYGPVYDAEKNDLREIKSLGREMIRLGKDIEKGARDIHKLYFFGRAMEFRALREDLREAQAKGATLSEDQRYLQSCEDFLLN